MVDEVRFSLVSVGLLPVRREGAEPVVIRRVRVAGVSVVLRDVALPTAPTGVVRTDTCNTSRHVTSRHFHNIVVVVVVIFVDVVVDVVVLTNTIAV